VQIYILGLQINCCQKRSLILLFLKTSFAYDYPNYACQIILWIAQILEMMKDQAGQIMEDLAGSCNIMRYGSKPCISKEFSMQTLVKLVN
jgi:hypothetical protein